LAAVLLATSLAVPPVRAGASFLEAPTPEDLADLATFQIHTTLPGAATKTTPAVMGFESLIDVHEPADGVADVKVHVVPDLAEQLVVVGASRLTDGPMPLRLELEFDLPGPEDEALVVGYDATASAAPTGFLLGVDFGGEGDVTRIDGDVGTVGAVAPLALLASTFERSAGTRVDPLDARVSFSQPGTSIGFVFETEPPAGRTHLELASTLPTAATVDVTQVKDGLTRSLHAVIDKVPASAAVDIVADGVDDTDVS
jgi:hypothetical protein